MKRNLAFVFLFLVLGAIGYLGCSIYDQLEEKQAAKERIAQLPEFSVIGLDERAVRSSDIVRQTPLIITYFSTECAFCQTEIRSIRRHKNLQQQADVYLISDETPDVLKQFASEFNLDSMKSIRVLQDRAKRVKKLFGINGVPSTYVYNSDGKLLESFKGETKAEVLYKLVKH